MIVDSSAIMSILLEEEDDKLFAGALAGSSTPPRLSAGNWIELAAVVTRTADGALWDLAEQLVRQMMISIEPVTVEQAEIAREAYHRYGLGTRHPARLNFGDCFAYALAKATSEPLLFKGNDFAKTDIVPAL
jgi:ribonuclease VapC